MKAHFIILSICLILTACSSKNTYDNVMYFSWENYTPLDDYEVAEYYINSNYVGNGSYGLSNVFIHINTMKDGSKLHIEKSPFKETDNGCFYFPPYHDYFDEFLDLIVYKKMSVTRNGFEGIHTNKKDIEILLIGLYRDAIFSSCCESEK
jgi:hypothetical protein